MNKTVIYIDCTLESSKNTSIYEKIKYNFNSLTKLQLIYKKNTIEYITENISLDWMRWVDSQQFFNWLELKKTQKQQYNIKNYTLAFRLELNIHTNR